MYINNIVMPHADEEKEEEEKDNVENRGEDTSVTLEYTYTA